MNHFKKLLACSMLLLVSATTFAQVKVKGIVKDSQGEPIIGATVKEQNTSKGVVTDFNGQFSIEVESAKSVITISYLGCVTENITVGGKTQFDIVLREDSKVLQDVVVVGYGTQKKATLTGAVSMVEGDDVLKGRSASTSE